MNAPQAGKMLTAIVIEKQKTPQLKVKFCNNTKPFYYDNSPQVPRYSITCIVDPNTHKDFINFLNQIQKNENISQSILKPDVIKQDGALVNSGNWTIKFNEKKPIRMVTKEGEKLLPFDEMEDISPGSTVAIEFDIIRYTKRGTTDSLLSLRPSLITAFKTTNHPQTSTAQTSSEEDFF